MSKKPASHKKIFLIAGTAVAIMFGFSFAMVPLYNLICKATGINTSVAGGQLLSPATAELLKQPVDLTREVLVQFTTTNHNGMPWDFYQRTQSVKVHPNQNTTVYFHVKNTTNHTMTVQAIPSMTPPEALSHFHKIECFCFRQQTLKAYESRDMPLIFRIDKDLPKDLHVITLAYTLFDATPKETKKG